MGGAEQVGASSCRSRRETGAASSQEVGGCSAGMSPVVVADGWESQRADGFTESLQVVGASPFQETICSIFKKPRHSSLLSGCCGFIGDRPRWRPTTLDEWIERGGL